MEWIFHNFYLMVLEFGEVAAFAIIIKVLLTSLNQTLDNMFQFHALTSFLGPNINYGKIFELLNMYSM